MKRRSIRIMPPLPNPHSNTTPEGPKQGPCRIRHLLAKCREYRKYGGWNGMERLTSGNSKMIGNGVIEAMRRDRRNGAKLAELASRYGLSMPTIGRLCKGV